MRVRALSAKVRPTLREKKKQKHRVPGIRYGNIFEKLRDVIIVIVFRIWSKWTLLYWYRFEKNWRCKQIRISIDYSEFESVGFKAYLVWCVSHSYLGVSVVKRP